jgi:two-component system LytT family sensor kinase
VGAAGAFTAELSVLGFRKMDWADLAGNSVQFAVVLFLWCSLYFSIKHWQQSAQERERLLRAEGEAREARLSALRYQLNPHFLFNSLNAVSTLVLDGDVPAATRMLAQIGELLRTSLDHEIVPEVPLSQEIAFTEQYLAIEQIRLGERLRVDLAISPATLDALVPSMLLQPLVENAVRHGIAPVVGGGTIVLRSEFHDGQLQIVVKNSGAVAAREDKPMNGIGLSNTIERLKTLYGTDQKFTLVWPRAGGCEVTVELPFRKSNQGQEVLLCAR